MARPYRIYVGSNHVKKVVRNGNVLFRYLPRYIATTGNSRILYSDDGVNFSVASYVSGDDYYRSFAKGSGVMVAMSSKLVRYSEDGMTWQLSNLTAQNNLQNVTFGGGKFVCVGTNSQYYHSENGATWTIASTHPSSGYRVCWDGTYFVAYKHTNQIYRSEDGDVWTEVAHTGATLYGTKGLAYGAGAYVNCGTGNNELYYATNLNNWTQVTTGNGWKGCTFAAGKHIVYGDGLVAYSTDGITFNVQELGNSVSHKWMACCFANGLYHLYDGSNGNTATSPDGITWTIGAQSKIGTSTEGISAIIATE